MSRYIDADEAKKNICALNCENEERYICRWRNACNAMRAIDETHSADVVPVVRCYECKHSYRLGGTKILYQCDHNGVRPNYWFCADGEKVTE